MLGSSPRRTPAWHWIVAIGISSWAHAHAGDILDLADEAFSRTPGLAERKALEIRGEVGALVDAVVRGSGIGGGTGDAADGPSPCERLLRAALTPGTHRGEDGTVIDVSPDGVHRFTTPDGRVATVLPNGRRFYQATGHSTVIDIDGGSDAGDLAPREPPVPPEPPPVEGRAATEGRDGEPAQGGETDRREPAPGRRPPPETRRHVESGAGADAASPDGIHHNTDEPGSHGDAARIDALFGTSGRSSPATDWDNLAAASTAAEEESEIVLRDAPAAIYRPPRGGEDDVVSASRIPGSGVEVFVRESGARQIRLPDGTVVTTYPGTEYVRITGADGQEIGGARRDDGLVQLDAGRTNVAIDPANGRTFILGEADGAAAAGGGGAPRIVVEADGGYAFTDSASSFQARRPDGSLDQAGYVDPGTGATVRYDGDTGTTRLYTPDGVLGGIRNGVTGVFVNPATGSQLPVQGSFRPPLATGNPAAVSIWATGQAEPPGQAPARFPTSAELATAYVEQARELLQQAADQARREGRDADSVRRIQGLADAARFETLTREQQQMLRRLAELGGNSVADGRGSGELAAIDAQIAAAEAALEAARRDADRKRRELESARSEAAAEIAETNQTLAQGERDLQVELPALDPGAQKAELAALEPQVRQGVEAARKRIDYRLFDRCPNRKSWDDCDHQAEKQQWLAEQMLKAMGPLLEMQARRLEQLRREIAEKEKKFEEKKKLWQVVKDQAERRLKDCKAKEQAASDRLRELERSSRREIQEKDEALFNLKQKRIEVALRPKRPKSDLQEFAESLGLWGDGR